MSKLKHKKFPKKPKATASISVMENYLSKYAQVKKENAGIDALNAKQKKLAAQVAGIGKIKFHAPAKKRKAPAAKKKSSKKRR